MEYNYKCVLPNSLISGKVRFACIPHVQPSSYKNTRRQQLFSRPRFWMRSRVPGHIYRNIREMIDTRQVAMTKIDECS